MGLMYSTLVLVCKHCTVDLLNTSLTGFNFNLRVMAHETQRRRHDRRLVYCLIIAKRATQEHGNGIDETTATREPGVDRTRRWWTAFQK